MAQHVPSLPDTRHRVTRIFGFFGPHSVDCAWAASNTGKMLRLRGITVDCAEPGELANFWAEALNYDERQLWEPYAGVKDPEHRDPNVTFQRASGRQHANRLHLDLYSNEPAGDVQRLVELGATQVQHFVEGDTWWWVLRDPAGNEFCVVAAAGADRSV